jgi:hypothetical protein
MQLLMERVPVKERIKKKKKLKTGNKGGRRSSG